MSETAHGIEMSFRKLIETKHFRSITVKDICADAGVSRKTFYAHYTSKEDIVDKALRRDVLQPAFDLGRLLDNDELLVLAKSVFGRMFQAVYADGAYYRALVAPMRGNDFTFLNIATAAFRELYGSMLSRVKQPCESFDAYYAAHYFAAAHAELLQKWICDDYPMPPEQICEVFIAVALPFWKSLESLHSTCSLTAWSNRTAAGY